MKKLILLLFLVPHLSFAEDIRLLTWNVYMLPKPIKNSMQKTRTGYIKDFIGSSEFDVVFFQEAFSGYFRRTLENELESTFPHSERLRKKPVLYPFMGPGLMVLSKFPVKTIAFDYFEDCARADCHASKGVHLVELTLPSGKRIQIANTHMQSGTGEKYQSIREKQIEQIRSLLKARMEPGVPQLLVGDLNIDAFKVKEFTKSLNRLDMNHIVNGLEQSHEEEAEEALPLVERMRNFISAGFEVSCIKEGSSDNPKFIDHVLYGNPNERVTFKDDRVLRPTFPLNGSECPLSDHRPRAVTIGI